MKRYKVSFLTGTAGMYNGLDPWDTNGERDYDALQGGVYAESAEEAIALAIEYLTNAENLIIYNNDGAHQGEFEINMDWGVPRVVVYNDDHEIVSVYYDFRAEAESAEAESEEEEE